MLGVPQRTDKRLLGQNLDRAMVIAAQLEGWSAPRREPLRRMLSDSLSRFLLRIESGEITPEQAAAQIRARSGADGGVRSGESAPALADELLLIFLTALTHDSSGRLAPLREYTFRCVQRIIDEASTGSSVRR